MATAQPTRTTGVRPARPAAMAAPMGGVACMPVRRTANNLPCIAGGTSRIRSVCAQAVIGAETKPSAAMNRMVVTALSTISIATIAAARVWPASIDGMSGRVHSRRTSSAAASNSPPRQCGHEVSVPTCTEPNGHGSAGQETPGACLRHVEQREHDGYRTEHRRRKTRRTSAARL